ncbi:DUF6223 family protein [Streptomyces sp. ISL-36]|uniref:DUF6223 family protein n=1 Tax=Streptomyces sp. ISL-36 TaxID=2819182 RepID=UPI002034A859|nr:DUF6223 family protein [Streptomyces sp. ISL-36]
MSVPFMSVHFLVAAPADLAAQPAAAAVDTLSAGRVGAIVAALTALTGVVVGGLALARSAGRSDRRAGRPRAVVALAAGVLGMVLGGLVAAGSDGSIGTGNGLGGAIVALVLGVIGTALGGLALARSHRTG